MNINPDIVYAPLFERLNREIDSIKNPNAVDISQLLHDQIIQKWSARVQGRYNLRTTGLPQLDSILSNGLPPGEIGFSMSPAAQGKTMHIVDYPDLISPETLPSGLLYYLDYQYAIPRHEEKRVYKIPVGDIPPESIEAYIESVAEKFRTNTIYEPMDGVEFPKVKRKFK